MLVTVFKLVYVHEHSNISQLFIYSLSKICHQFGTGKQKAKLYVQLLHLETLTVSMVFKHRLPKNTGPSLHNPN